MSAVTDLVSYLAILDLVDSSSGWPSVRGVLHDASDRLVAFRADGGISEIGASSGVGSAAYRDPRVHVTVRGAPNERDLAESRIWEIYLALHGKMNLTMGSTVYHRVDGPIAPIEVGQDENARPLFTVAFKLATAQGAPA